MKNSKRRVLWLLCVIAVLVSCVILSPLSAYAAEETPRPTSSYPDFITPTPIPTPTPTPVPTPSPTPEPTPPLSSSETENPTPNPTPNTADTTATPNPTESPDSSPPPSAGASTSPSPSPSASPVAGGISASPSPAGNTPVPTPPGSNYQVIARLNAKGNEFSLILFYGGAAAILLGLVGTIILIVLYVKNRKKRGTLQRDGIFEEIEAAETRSALPTQFDMFDDYDEYDDDYDPYEQYDTHPDEGTRYSDDYYDAPPTPASPQPTGPVMPMEISMYTEEFDRNDLYPRNSSQAAADDYDEPAEDDASDYNYDDYADDDSAFEEDVSQVSFDTDEILREALQEDDDSDE